MLTAQHPTADEISRRLHTVRFGRVIHVLDVVASTNDVAKQLAEAGAEEGTAVIAREQVAGRGRRDRRWVSPRGGLWASMVLRPPLPAEAWPLLGCALALAACDAIDAATGLRTGVKWPNDVMIRSRKLGGVLVEGTPEFAVGGVGINANIPEGAFDQALAQAATSLQIVTGHPVDLNTLAAGLLGAIERSYAQWQADKTSIVEEWRRRSVVLGQLVRVIGATAFDGVVEGLDETGALLVRTAEGLQVVRAGEVSIRLTEPERPRE